MAWPFNAATESTNWRAKASRELPASSRSSCSTAGRRNNPNKRLRRRLGRLEHPLDAQLRRGRPFGRRASCASPAARLPAQSRCRRLPRPVSTLVLRRMLRSKSLPEPMMSFERSFGKTSPIVSRYNRAEVSSWARAYSASSSSNRSDSPRASSTRLSRLARPRSTSCCESPAAWATVLLAKLWAWLTACSRLRKASSPCQRRRPLRPVVQSPRRRPTAPQSPAGTSRLGAAVARPHAPPARACPA